MEQGRTKEIALPSLSRDEYIRLLSAAKSLGRERTYLLIKLFACTGIQIVHIPDLTVEILETDDSILPSYMIRIPDMLRRELLNYAKRRNIVSGMIFRTRNGMPIDRSNMNHEIHILSAAAGVPSQKCNPRCLCRLYRQTQQEIRDGVEVLVQREVRRILEKEQAIIGWDV